MRNIRISVLCLLAAIAGGGVAQDRSPEELFRRAVEAQQARNLRPPPRTIARFFACGRTT